MYNVFRILAFLANLLLIASDLEMAENSYGPPGPPLPSRFLNDNSVTNFNQALVQYTSMFLSNITQTFPNKTVNGSPLGTFYLLALLGLYSYGQTLNEILTALNLDNKNQIRSTLTQINNVLTGDSDGVGLTVQGSNIFGNIQYPFTEDFQKDAENIGLGQALNVDFGMSENAAGFINSIINEETDSKILNIVSSDDFNENTQLATVSAFVFNAQLKIRFEPDNVVPGLFFQNSGPVETQYLFQKEVYRYGESQILKSKIVELPYKSTFTAYVILPNENTDIEDVIDKLDNYKTLNTVFNNLLPTIVDLYLPNFTNETTIIDAKGIVQGNLNVPSVFDSDLAQFDNIVKNNAPVAVSFGIQEFIFESNADGGPSPGISDDLPSAMVRLNRPFIIMITVRVNLNHIPVICGVRNSAL